MIRAAAAFFAALLPALALAAEPHHVAYNDWFVEQMMEERPARCCGTVDEEGGDAHYVNVRSTADGKYEVEVQPGAWMLYDRPVNPWHDNPTGRNVAWWLGDYPNLRFLCLRLANGT